MRIFAIAAMTTAIALGIVAPAAAPAIAPAAAHGSKVRVCPTPTPAPTVTVTATPTPAPTVTVTATPTPTATPPSTVAPLWSADYETGDLSQFAATPWNNVPLAPRVTTIARAGSYAGQYTIPAGGSRSENVASPTFREGDDLWFNISTRLDVDVPLGTTDWQVFTQWKNDGYGSPPLAMYISRGVWQIGGGYGYPGSLVGEPGGDMANNSVRDIGPATAGAWDDWLVHIVFSSTSSKSLVEVWRNGTQVVSGFRPTVGTLYPGLTSYWKMGYYRSTAIAQSSTVRHDGLRVSAVRPT